MMKNRAIWVALAVIAAAAMLMFFVVLPQMRGDKTAEQLAKKAGETAEKVVEQAKDAAQQTVETAKQTVADKAGEVAVDVKSGVLAKMARLKADTSAATSELQALFAEGKAATPEQIAAAKAKLTTALKAATQLQLPAGVDAAIGDVVVKAQQGAAKALAAIEAMPSDAEGARKAIEAMKSGLMDAFEGVGDNKVETEPVKSVETAKAVLPKFDVLRVEPDGSTVIAGSAEPGTKLNIVDTGKVIASVDVGPTGDFAAVLDNPLTAGDHEITLQAVARDGQAQGSEEIATVSVPKDKSGELLAMVTTPGEASRIMVMPEAKTSNAATSAATTPEAKAADAKTPEVKVAETSTQEVKTGTEVAAGAEAKPAAAAATEEKPADTGKPADTKVVEAATTDASKEAVTDAGKSADAVNVQDLAGKAAVVDVAKAPDTADQQTKAVQAETKAAPEVQVSAVEIEGTKLFVAGGAKPNALVRVYADDKLVAEVSADKNGRFVADNTMPLAVGDHMIRADVMSADGAKVEFRASVPFFRPEGEQLAAVAGDPSAKAAEMTPLADGAYDKAREEAGKAVALLKDLYKEGKTPTAEELAAARSSTEFALKTLSEIRVPAEADPVAKDMAAKAAAHAAKALTLLNALPQDAAAVKQALGQIDDAVTSATAPSMRVSSDEVKPDDKAAQVEDKPAVADVVEAAKPADNGASADVQEQSSSAASSQTSQSAHVDVAADSADKPADTPKVIEQTPLKPSETSVIIRRGDTLWQISRRVYGKGIRYTTIYLANEGQIADPNRIMPGQIFGVPDQPLPNAEELHRKRLGVE